MNIIEKIAARLLSTNVAKDEIDARARQMVRHMLDDELTTLRSRVQKAEERAEFLQRLVEPVATATYLDLSTSQGINDLHEAVQAAINDADVTITTDDVRDFESEVEKLVENKTDDLDIPTHDTISEIACDAANDIVGELRIVRS